MTATRRPYTGFDGIGHRRPGTEAFVAAIQKHTAGALWNNGTFVVRPMRGKKTMSVHATGRAMDVSRRKTGKHRGSNRTYLLRVCEWLTANADEIGLELLCDYQWTGQLPNGKPAAARIWKCDRIAWKAQVPGSIMYGGSGDWLHIELDPDHANRTDWVAAIVATMPTPETPDPTPPKPDEPPAYSGRPSKQGSTGKQVEAIQRQLRLRGYDCGNADGKFGPRTDAAVRQFQMDHGLTVDGIVGPKTWAALFAPPQ